MPPALLLAAAACCAGAIRAASRSCAASAPPCMIRRLEPTGARVVHGAGQSNDEFGGYSRYLPAATRPLLYARYRPLAELNRTGAGAAFVDALRRDLDSLGDAGHVVLLHLGLALTPGATTLDLVNAGAYDVAIDELAGALPRQGRPVFLRIGYEFNGHWNGYEPTKFVRAWQRIAAVVARNQTLRDQVALVWDFSCNEQEHVEWAPYYPGDEYVDWWGVNVLDPGDGPSAPGSPCVQAFVDAAANRSFPVLVAESMPRYTGTQQEDSWAKWFEPYFAALLRRPAVKGFSYINRDCRNRSSCVGGAWGDARIEDAAFGLGEKYAASVGGGGFIHAADLGATCDALNAPC